MKTRWGCTMVLGAALLLLTTSPADAQHGYGHHGGYGGYSGGHHHGGYGGYHHGGGYSYVAPSYRVGLSPTLYGYRLGGGYGYGLSRGYGYGYGGYRGYSLYRPRLNYISSGYLGGYGLGGYGYGLGSYGWGGLSSYSYPYSSGLYGWSGYGWPYYGSSYYSYFGLPYPSYSGRTLGGYYGGAVYRPYVTNSQYLYTPSYYSATYIPGVACYGAVCGAYGYSSLCCGY